jgi:hypothetical protein
MKNNLVSHVVKNGQFINVNHLNGRRSMKIENLSMKLSQKNSNFFSGFLVLPKFTQLASHMMVHFSD